MAEQTGTPETIDTPGANGDERPEENLRAELDRRREKQERAERELQELRDKLIEFEDRDKSEVERAKARAERAEQQLASLSGKITTLEKGAWVRSAAAELNFHDPEDAVSHLGGKMSGFEDERDAKRAVQALAKSKKHLVREDKKEPERTPIARMFAGDGVPPQQQNSNRGQLTPQQAAAQREVEFATGLAAELAKFRDGKWTTPGGIG